MSVHVARPQIVLPDHKVTTEDIVDDICAHHPDHPRLGAVCRVVRNCGVNTRYFTRPLSAPTVSGTAGIDERARSAFDDALEMAATAAQRALSEAGLAAPRQAVTRTSTRSSPRTPPAGRCPTWMSP